MTLTQYFIGLILAFALTTAYEFRHPLWQQARTTHLNMRLRAREINARRTHREGDPR